MSRTTDILSGLTHERLCELLSYDNETGHLFWKMRRSPRSKAGEIAGTVTPHGYRVIKIEKRLYMAHRLVWLYMTGAWPSNEIDHINSNRLDNRIENLREATRAENMQNVKTARKDSRSQLIGVNFYKNWWWARITVESRLRTIGKFQTAEEAHKAYLNAKAELHPFGTL